MIEFNPEKHYLGTLCRNEHDFKCSGMSLRYKTGSCCECAILNSEKWQRNNKKKKAECVKRYRTKNKEKISEQGREYYKNNKEKIDRRRAEYRLMADRKEVKKRADNKHNKKRVAELSDIYIKNQIVKLGTINTFKEIPQELIDLKRQQLKLHRAIKEATNGLN